MMLGTTADTSVQHTARAAKTRMVAIISTQKIKQFIDKLINVSLACLKTSEAYEERSLQK